MESHIEHLNGFATDQLLFCLFRSGKGTPELWDKVMDHIAKNEFVQKREVNDFTLLIACSNFQV